MKHSQVTLREGRLSDLDVIVALDRATETAPHWPVAAYSAILAASGESVPQRHLVVAENSAAEDKPALAGFAVAVLSGAQGHITAELEDVIVAAELRRTGIGRALCEAAILWARSNSAAYITLEVRASSTGAIALYSSLGFRQSGCRPRYYSNPQDDAIMMSLE